MAYKSSSSTNYNYDVFLSFRGEDTRKFFTDHLYTGLVQQGFRIFRDHDEIEKGDHLKSKLEQAICQSKISIVILSKDYAGSTWCLDELVMILQRRRISGHVVLPVFYHVDPSHIRNHMGMVADAFATHQRKLEDIADSEVKRKLMEKIKEWRSALSEVAGLVGLDLCNEVDGHESKFIQKIIKVIKGKVNPTALDVAPYIVGLDSRAKNVNMWVADQSTDVSVRAICGMGGIGKTTVAKFVYNQNCNSFDGSSFLANIREVSERTNGLVHLQRQLLSDVCKKKQEKIHNVAEGIAKIRKFISCKRVLLVLDDVDEADQIYDIIGMQDWLFPGSKVIITTRKERLLKPHQIFSIRELGEEESIKLFCFHAFGEDFSLENYTENINRAVHSCGGLPLALKVIGSSLSRKSEKEWVGELAKLGAIPHSQIVKKLKISYDYLEDDCDKRLFLDIACFFVGTKMDSVIKILEKCDLHPQIGIQNLIDRCLLESDHFTVLRMHKLIQDMAREIIRQESHEAGERSRIWNQRDALRVLRNETGTNAIEGFTLDMLNETGSNGIRRRIEEFDDKSILPNYGSSLKQRYLRFLSGQSTSTNSTSQNDVYLRTDALKNMTKLRLLKLHHVKLTGSYEDFPKSLVLLSWHGFPLKNLPVELMLENLVVLDLHHSRLQQVWKETPFLESLKILDLSYSEWLERTPNFLRLPKLEKLILKGCVSLIEVCESIGKLESLDLLDLQDCITLKNLPRNIGMLGNLRTLIISGCNIGELSSGVRNIRSLNVLNDDGIVVSSLKSSSEKVKWWKPIVWRTVLTPRKGPDTLWANLPCSLIELSLSGCNLSDDSFPENFDNLPLLSILDLSKSQFRRIPNCVTSHKGLTILYVDECHRLESLEFDNGLPLRHYNYIEASNCKSLKNLGSLKGQSSIALRGCDKLVEVEDCSKQAGPNMQAIYEYGIFSIFFGNESIARFSGEKHHGSSICFIVPSLSTSRIQFLKVWCMSEDLEVDKHDSCWDIFSWLFIKIENKTKDLTWIYSPCSYSYSGNLQWLSRWKFGNQMEAGDVINITFSFECEIKECGYKVVYHPENEDENENTSNMDDESHHDFPELRLSTGEYFLGLCCLKDFWFRKRDSEHVHSRDCEDIVTPTCDTTAKESELIRVQPIFPHLIEEIQCFTGLVVKGQLGY